MRDISLALSSSSSSSQQNGNNTAGLESKRQQKPPLYQPQQQQQQEQHPQQQPQQGGGGGQLTLINEISTLRSRLRELDNNDNSSNAMNRPRSLLGFGEREPPQGESALVDQLRNQLSKMEQEKAEMELTLMNQMSNLAYENQATIDGLHTRLAQAEKTVESLQQERQQQQQQQWTPNNASSNSPLELIRLRKSLNEERGMRKALEEERDVRQDQRNSFEQENATLKQEMQEMVKQMTAMQSSNTELTRQVKALKAEKDDALKKMEMMQSQTMTDGDRESLIAEMEIHYKSSLAEVERNHQAQMTELKQTYQRRCNHLEKEMTKSFDKKQMGLGQLHQQITSLEMDKDQVERHVAQLEAELQQEQTVNHALEQSLQEQNQNNEKLWATLEESEKRCNMLEQELSQQFADGHDRGDLRSENEMLSNQIAAIHEQCVSEQEKSSKLKATLDAERSTNSKLRLSLRQHQQRYEELNRNLHKNQSGMGMVNGKVSNLERDKKALSSQLAQVQDQLVKEKAKTKELESSVAEQQEVIESQKQQQTTGGRRQSDVAALENAHVELQSVLNSYQTDMARLDRKVKLAEQQITERNRQNQRLEVEINEERRIRKSLAAQLSQAKMANKRQAEASVCSSSLDGSENLAQMETELLKLRKENTKLNEELKMRVRAAGQIDPAEVELLRQQNKILSERGNGLHSDQVRELEQLREKTKALDEELTELRHAKASSTTSSPSNRVFAQNEMKQELEQLKKQNASLQEELQTAKQELASSVDNRTQQNTQRQTRADTLSTPPRRVSRRASPSPRRVGPSPRIPASPRAPSPVGSVIEPPPSNIHMPPLSPPLAKPQQPPPKKGSPRTPVKGIVESFERRISRSNSLSSLEAAQLGMKSEAGHRSGPIPTPTPQAQGAVSTEVDDLRRELQEEKAAVFDLRSKLRAEGEVACELEGVRRELEEEKATVSDLQSKLRSKGEASSELGVARRELEIEKATAQDLKSQLQEEVATAEELRKQLQAETENVDNLRLELSRMEETEKKRAQLERALEFREQDVVRLEASVKEMEGRVLDYGDIHEAMEQYRVTVQDLQAQLENETEQVATLKAEIAKLEPSEAERAKLESTLQERDAEVTRLRLRVTDLEDMALEVGDANESMEQEKTRSRDLQRNLDTKSALVSNLRETLSSMEETLEHEKVAKQDMQSQFEAQSEVVATLRDELSRTDEVLEAEKKKAAELQKQLSSETEVVASLREELTLLTTKLDQEKSAAQGLQQNLSSESQLVSSLRNELSRMDEIEAARTRLDKEVLESQQENKRLRFQVGELEVLLANAETLASERSDTDRLRGELAQADEAKKAYETKLFDVRSEMEVLSGEIAKLGTTLEQSREESKNLKEEVSSYQASNEKLEQRKREDEALIERLQTELGAARMGLEASLDEMERMRGDNSQRQSRQEIARLTSELEVAKQALDINVEEMEKLQRCVKDADASRMIAVKQSLSSEQERQEEIEGLKRELAAKEEASVGHDEETKRLRSQVEALQQELEDAMTHIEELKEMMANMQSAHDAELKDAEKNGKRSNRSIGAEVNTLKVELTKNQMSKADMEMEFMKQVHDLETKIDAMQNDMDKELQEKEIKLHQLQYALSRKDDEIRQLEKEREQICSSMNSISTSRKDEMDDLQEELLVLTSKTASQTREIQQLKMQLEEHDFRQSEFQRLNQRIEDLEDELRSVPRRREVGQSDIEIMRTENKMLRETIRDMTMERRTLQEKLEAHLAEKSTSKSTQVLRERNAALKKEVERLTKRLKKMEHSMTRFTI